MALCIKPDCVEIEDLVVYGRTILEVFSILMRIVVYFIVTFA